MSDDSLTVKGTRSKLAVETVSPQPFSKPVLHLPFRTWRNLRPFFRSFLLSSYTVVLTRRGVYHEHQSTLEGFDAIRTGENRP